MEAKCLKRYSLTVLVILMMFFSYAQEASTLKLRSVSAGVSYFTSIVDSFESDFTGFGLAADLAFDLDDIIFSTFFSYGNESLIVIDQSYWELNITVGKVWKLKDWLALEAHAGLGYFQYKNGMTYFNGIEEVSGNLGIPIRLKGVFPLSDHLAIVINPNIHFSTYYSIIFSTCLAVQYNF